MGTPDFSLIAFKTSIGAADPPVSPALKVLISASPTGTFNKADIMVGTPPRTVTLYLSTRRQ